MNKNAWVIVVFCFCIMIAPVTAQTGKTVVATHGSAPTIDGVVNDSEWSDASSVTFNGIQVFVKQDDANLYVGFKAPVLLQSAMFIYFDVNNDNSSSLQPDDICIGMNYNGTLSEFHKSGSTALWELASASGWTAGFQATSTTCEAEFKIEYAKLGITAGIDKTMGIDFNYVSFATLENYFWSSDPNYQTSITPSTWGTMNPSGSNGIPEFPNLALLSLMMIAVLFLAIVYRRSNPKASK